MFSKIKKSLIGILIDDTPLVIGTIIGMINVYFLLLLIGVKVSFLNRLLFYKYTFIIYFVVTSVILISIRGVYFFVKKQYIYHNLKNDFMEKDEILLQRLNIPFMMLFFLIIMAFIYFYFPFANVDKMEVLYQRLLLVETERKALEAELEEKGIKIGSYEKKTRAIVLVESTIDEYEKKLDEVNEEIENRKEILETEEGDEQEKLEKEIEALNKEKEKLMERITNSDEKIKNLINEMPEVSPEELKRLLELERRKSEINELYSAIAKAEKKLKEALSEYNVIEEALEELRKEIIKKENEVESSEKEIALKKSEIREIEKRLTDSSDKLSDEEILNLNDRRSRLEGEVTALQKHIINLKNEIAKLLEVYNIKTGEHKVNTSIINESRSILDANPDNEINKLKERIRELDDKDDSSESDKYVEHIIKYVDSDNGIEIAEETIMRLLNIKIINIQPGYEIKELRLEEDYTDVVEDSRNIASLTEIVVSGSTDVKLMEHIGAIHFDTGIREFTKTEIITTSLDPSNGNFDFTFVVNLTEEERAYLTEETKFSIYILSKERYIFPVQIDHSRFEGEIEDKKIVFRLKNFINP